MMDWISKHPDLYVGIITFIGLLLILIGGMSGGSGRR